MKKKPIKETTTITITVKHLDNDADSQKELAVEKVLEDIKNGYTGGDYNSMTWDLTTESNGR